MLNRLIMKKYIIPILIFLLIVSFSCDKVPEEVFCGCTNPLKDIEWLNDIYRTSKQDSYHDALIDKVIIQYFYFLNTFLL